MLLRKIQIRIPVHPGQWLKLKTLGQGGDKHSSKLGTKIKWYDSWLPSAYIHTPLTFGTTPSLANHTIDCRNTTWLRNCVGLSIENISRSLLLCTETKAWCHDIRVRGCDVQLLSTTSSEVLKVSEFLNPMDYFYCNVLLSISLLLQRESKFFVHDSSPTWK